ncbi:MAG: ParB/RepB/Spo0J family partition protein [Spirochaetales bacterium]|nr:ParB/RepB/Spo0J family partition protein [Spirochaetales bacterium]
MSKKALGKGIGALFRDIDEQINTRSIIEVPLDAIKPNPYQPRKSFSDEGLSELADSIREKGVIQPIIAEKQQDESYILISGERRVRASRIAGLATIPAILGTFSVMEKLENALIENIQRENLSSLEEAEGYRRLIDTFNLNQEEIAKKVGKKRSTIANTLRLLKLPAAMKAALDEGAFTPGHARAVLSLVNPSDQKLLFQEIVTNGISVRAAEQYAADIAAGNKSMTKKPSKQKKNKKKPAEIKEIEDRLIEAFGTKVELKGSSQKGKIEISYYSMEDLERIIEIVSS